MYALHLAWMIIDDLAAFKVCLFELAHAALFLMPTVPPCISTGSPAGLCASAPPPPSRGATALKPHPAAQGGTGAGRVLTRRMRTPESAASQCCLPCLRSEKRNHFTLTCRAGGSLLSEHSVLSQIKVQKFSMC